MKLDAKEQILLNHETKNTVRFSVAVVWVEELNRDIISPRFCQSH